MSQNQTQGKEHKRDNISVMGTEDQIFGFETEMDPRDLYLMIPAGVVGFALMRFLQSYNRTLGLLMIPTFLGIAGAYIYVCPRDEAPHERALATVRFWSSEKDLSTDFGDDDLRSDSISAVGRVRPAFDATERDDGTLVNGVSIDASSMSLATNNQWEDVTDDYEDLHEKVDFPTQTTIGGRTVDPGVITDGLDERLTDEDVTDIPALKKVIRDHQDEFPAEFSKRGTSIRTFHVNIPVSESDAQLDDHEAIDKLSDLPVVGDAIRRVASGASTKSADHVLEEQAKMLDQRLQTVEGGFLDVGRCKPERLTVDQHAAVVEEYWRHETPRGRRARSTPEESRFSDAVRERVRETPRRDDDTNDAESETDTDADSHGDSTDD